MFGVPFDNKTLRTIVVAFENMFSNIIILRTDSGGNEIKRLAVPITHGPRDRYLVRLKDDPTLQRPIDLVLPRMSYQVESIEYDGKRKLNTMGKNFKSISGDNSQLLREYNPVPYNINFSLSIISKTEEDGNQILGQILPFFTPDYTITIMSIPQVGLKDDIPYVLKGVALSDNFDDEWQTRRDIIWTLAFTAKAYFYGPVSKDPVITKTQEDYLATGGDINDPAVRAKTPRVFRITTEPNPLDAAPDSDYTITETKQAFDDGKKFNPETLEDEDIT